MGTRSSNEIQRHDPTCWVPLYWYFVCLWPLVRNTNNHFLVSSIKENTYVLHICQVCRNYRENPKKKWRLFLKNSCLIFKSPRTPRLTLVTTDVAGGAEWFSDCWGAVPSDWTVGCASQRKVCYPGMCRPNNTIWIIDLVIIGLCNVDMLTHLPLVPQICVSESGQHWFR